MAIIDCPIVLKVVEGIVEDGGSTRLELEVDDVDKDKEDVDTEGIGTVEGFVDEILVDDEDLEVDKEVVDEVAVEVEGVTFHHGVDVDALLFGIDKRLFVEIFWFEDEIGTIVELLLVLGNIVVWLLLFILFIVIILLEWLYWWLLDVDTIGYELLLLTANELPGFEVFINVFVDK